MGLISAGTLQITPDTGKSFGTLGQGTAGDSTASSKGFTMNTETKQWCADKYISVTVMPLINRESSNQFIFKMKSYDWSTTWNFTTPEAQTAAPDVD